MNIDFDEFFSIILTLKVILFLIPCFYLTGLFLSFIYMGKNRVFHEFLDTAGTLPMVFPPIVTGFFLIFIFGKNGFSGKYLDIVFSFKGLAAAGYISGLPFITRSVKSGFSRDLHNLCKASYTLGRNKASTFFYVVVPELRINILSGMILSTGRVLGEVGISLMVGGNIAGKTNTVSLEIYNCILDGNFEKAVLLSAVLSIFSIFLFFLFKVVLFSGGKGE